jgi:hypothetical protein
VDASACLLPETTWFVVNQPHAVQRGEVVRWFFSAEEAPTVFSNPDYPQFLEMTVVGGHVYPYVPPEPVPDNRTAGEKFLDYMADVMKFFMFLLFWWVK